MLHIGSPEALVTAVAQLMPHNRGPVPSIRHFSLFDLEEPRLALVEASLVRTILLRNDAITKSASRSIPKREDAEAWPFAAMLEQNPWSRPRFVCIVQRLAWEARAGHRGRYQGLWQSSC
jgi:hypothetical protein